MVAFEHFFSSLKKTLEKDGIYDIWPDFEPEYDDREHAWTNLRGLGDTLLLNCGQCDGPSDMRHLRCKDCVNQRNVLAKDTFHKTMGRSINKWSTIILCRIHTD